MISDHDNLNGECFSPVGSSTQFGNNDHNGYSTSNLSRSSAISVCSSSNLSSTAIGSKCLVTVFLPGCRKPNSIELVVDLKSRISNILSQVAVLVGIVDVEFFGLATRTDVPDEEYQFLEQEAKLQNILPRNVLKGLRRSTSGFFRKQHHARMSEHSVVNLYLRVVCYVDNPALLRDYVALQLYFDQLRENALEYGQLFVPESCFTLGALALQADQQMPLYPSFFGPLSKSHSRGTSSTPEDLLPSTSEEQQNLQQQNLSLTNDVLSLYVPDWLIRSHGAAFLSLHLPRLQQELHEMSRVEAQLMYCRYASQRPFHHNLHLYGIKRKKTDSYHTLWLGIGFRGVDIFEDVEGRFKKLIGTFEWVSIAKIQAVGKSIEMRVVGGKHKYSYFADSEERAANLLRLVRLAHQLQLQLTRSTDSRLQAIPAVRQDFPALRRVLKGKNQDKASTATSPRVPAVKTITKERFDDSQKPRVVSGGISSNPTGKASMPGTPGWAPSVLDRQFAAGGVGTSSSSQDNSPTVEVVEKSHYSKAIVTRAPEKYAYCNENFNDYDDEDVVAVAENEDEKVTTPCSPVKPIELPEEPFSPSKATITKAHSLDNMLNNSKATAEGGCGNGSRRIGASSESYLANLDHNTSSVGPIVPVRL